MRKNKGNHEGKYLGGVMESSWSIFETAKGFRAASVAAVSGKANYSFAMIGGKIDKKAPMDAIKLQEERPELFEAIEQFFSSADVAAQISSDDEFGDIAMSQGKRLAPMQQWKRALLNMRMHELEHAAKREVSFWDAGIRMTYSGIFKFRIDDATYEQAMKYITNHATDVEIQSLLAVLRDFYDGKYRPKPCSTLEMQFNLIAGDAPDEYKDLL